jgi:hypothetical protein
MAGRELGRISGPLLADNLLRNGTNLAFDTQVLYLDVVNKRIGANNSAPATDLYTPTAIDSTNITVDTASTIANFYITTNNIQNATASITLGNPVITPGLSTNNLYLSGNTVANTVTNNDINVTANGTGEIIFNNSGGPLVPVGGSLSFPGGSASTRILDLNVGFTLGTSAYTIEGWFQLPNFSSTYSIFGAVNAAGDTTGALNLFVTSSTNFLTDGNGGLGQFNYTVPTMSINTWYHFALVRSGTTETLFFNGTRSSTGTQTNSINYSTATKRIGASYQASWPGLISNLRVVVGTAIYTPTNTTITVPTSALSNVANTKLLLNTASSGTYIVDSSGINTVTNTGSATYNIASPIGTPSSNVAVTVNGTLHATGSITFDGAVVLGDSATDTITFGADVGSNILPLTNNSYTLGTSGLVWNNVYTNTFSVTSTTVPTTSATTMTAGNFSFSGNTITNTSTDQNFRLVPSGTGVISVNGTAFNAANSFTNTSSGAYTLAGTGTGYYKFNNATGVSIGSGTTAQRPGNAVAGMTRYNTDLQYGETYNGYAWLPIGGQGSSLTLAQVTTILLTNVIIFGF